MGFIVDFCAPSRRLVVEVDGGYHARRLEADARRDRALVAAGYRVLRLPAALVQHRLGDAVALVAEALAAAKVPWPGPGSEMRFSPRRRVGRQIQARCGELQWFFRRRARARENVIEMTMDESCNECERAGGKVVDRSNETSTMVVRYGLRGGPGARGYHRG